MALQSRRNTVSRQKAADEGKPLIIMGNGPSLADLISTDTEALARSVTMALNFAANADEFTMIKPDFYLLADPHFFAGRESDPNVGRMFGRFNAAVDWPMTLYVPTATAPRASESPIRQSVSKISTLSASGASGVLKTPPTTPGSACPAPATYSSPR